MDKITHGLAKEKATVGVWAVLKNSDDIHKVVLADSTVLATVPTELGDIPVAITVEPLPL